MESAKNQKFEFFFDYGQTCSGYGEIYILLHGNVIKTDHNTMLNLTLDTT